MNEIGPAPFVIDESRTVWDEEKGRYRRWATPDSVREACVMVGKASLADEDITFKAHQGPFAIIAAQECEVQHLAMGWPQGFLMYAGLIEAAQAAPKV
ncbi:MAG: hypothetical protein WDN27_04430 [Candidatus Saccharibacteria bacterium]